MRVVVQRVSRAAVRVNDQLISQIGQGILVFLGIEKGDQSSDADLLLEKVVNLRIFEDSDGRMNRSLLDISGEMLVVSQFTLMADCQKGRRPSFIRAEDPQPARGLYEYFLQKGRDKLGKVAAGEFQAMMTVEIHNSGPVTILMDSKNKI
ncbi:MAG: D-aminoacyl-tRNA deacylase [Syntrophales bacterium]|jgi:D-tyrosyl-tRNA(Tyr) deacylase